MWVRTDVLPADRATHDKDALPRCLWCDESLGMSSSDVAWVGVDRIFEISFSFHLPQLGSGKGRKQDEVGRLGTDVLSAIVARFLMHIQF